MSKKSIAIDLPLLKASLTSKIKHKTKSTAKRFRRALK